MTKAKAWYAHFPGDAYALGPFRFDEPVTERQARAEILEWHSFWIGKEIKRLPNGFQIWKA